MFNYFCPSPTVRDVDELIGFEEHLHDVAYECGEIAAMRREAEDEARKEAEMFEFEQEELRRAWGYLCKTVTVECTRTCDWTECQTDEIPF